MRNDLKKIKILLIDDEKITRNEFVQIIQSSKFELDTASNSIEGSEKIITSHYDIVLLDIRMPDLNNRFSNTAGIELLEWIKRNKPQLPVIMLSVIEDLEIAVKLMKLGAKDYLIKDKFKTDEILLKIEESLNRNALDIISLIKNGESEKLEFKSTIRWNLITNRSGKEIEFSWLKTIVAFLNTKGGDLLIGVDDNGKIIGVEADNFPNNDSLLRHLNNLINNHIGFQFIKYINYGLINIKNKSILYIHCEKVNEPVFFLEEKTKEDFYIRVGPSNRRLSSRQMLHFLKQENRVTHKS